MTRSSNLSRGDIRQAEDRLAGALTLRYTGRHLRFNDRLYGYGEGVFFAVVLSEVPLPQPLLTLASAVCIDLDVHPGFVHLTAELRKAVARLLLAEAAVDAPELLAPLAEPRTTWLPHDLQKLEHAVIIEEAALGNLSRIMERHLRARVVAAPSAAPPIRSFAGMAPPSLFAMDEPSDLEAMPEAEVVEMSKEVSKEEPDDGPMETSQAVGKRVLASVRVARDQELPQRLPGGARRALGRQPPGIYVSYGSTLERKSDICSAMVLGAETGKRSGESTVIDWDGEWPVVARRYGAHGRIVYRVEDALRRHGLGPGETA